MLEVVLLWWAFALRFSNMNAFEGSFELLLVTIESSIGNPERVRELLHESLERINQSRPYRYPEVIECIETPLWAAWAVLPTDYNKAMEHVAKAMAAYRQGFAVPTKGWFKAVLGLDEPVGRTTDRFGPTSDNMSTRLALVGHTRRRSAV